MEAAWGSLDSYRGICTTASGAASAQPRVPCKAYRDICMIAELSGAPHPWQCYMAQLYTWPTWGTPTKPTPAIMEPEEIAILMGLND